MRLIIASCLLFALSTAQTDCPAIRMYGGICDDPIQVDVVYVLDRDLQGDVVGATTSFGDFDQLKGFMADLLDNFVIDSATNTDKNLAFGMVTVDGNGVYSDGATGGSLSLSSNNFVAGLKAAISTRTLGVGADNDNFLEGINAGLDMLAASQDIGQSQALVVFVDKNTWESANKDTCTTLSDRMTGISLLFIEIGTFNTVGNCFGTATRLPQSSYSDLAVSNEDNEALCGATLLETYFGDYTFDTSAVSTDGVTRYSFALNTRTDAIIWNGGSWEITNDAGSTARGTSDNHPYPPYSLFYGLGIFNRQIILAKCYNPPTLSPTQEPTVEPTDNPTANPTSPPSSQSTQESDSITLSPTFRPTRNPTFDPTAVVTQNPDGVLTTTNPNWASSHGDPIIWTFRNECYDLDEDGLYVASTHPEFNHDVRIAVYNHYMRTIQVTDRKGTILLDINSLGDIINHWPYNFKETMLKCPINKRNSCSFFYKEYRFDAQDFQFVVHIMLHQYEDPALKSGGNGVHLDIFPRIYSDFNEELYSGIYFESPFSLETKKCPANINGYPH